MIITNFVKNKFLLNQKNRENWLSDKLKSILKGARILDAGAGELKYKYLCKDLIYVSQDFGGYDGVGNNEGLQTKKWDNSKLDIISDIINIPEKDNSFDAIMCVEVFEHIPEPIKAVQEFNRLLKKDGVLILTAPFCSITHFAPYFFYTGFSKYWYEKVLEDNGFRLIEIKSNGNFFSFIIQELLRSFHFIDVYLKINIFFKFIFKIILIIPISFLLIIFFILSSIDNKSNESLCFGINIVAKKN